MAYTLSIPHNTFLTNCLHSALLSTLVLIFNELRSVNKSFFCIHYHLHSALFTYTIYTVCTKLYAHKYTCHANNVWQHREGVKIVGATDCPPSLCPTNSRLMLPAQSATSNECRQLCRQNPTLSTLFIPLIFKQLYNTSAECRQNTEIRFIGVYIESYKH